MLVKMCVMTFVYEYALQVMYGMKAKGNERQRRVINSCMRRVLCVYFICMSAFGVASRFVPDITGMRNQLAAMLLMLTGLSSFIDKYREKNIPHNGQ